jgi:hypothetical protein
MVIVPGRSTGSLEVIEKVPSLAAVIKRSTRAVAYVYGGWCALWLIAAFLNVAEARIGAHLVLAATGMPSSLVSLYLPHASMQGIVAAAVLGLTQWVALVAWWSTDEPDVKRDDL